jgi:zinc protease
MDLLKQQWNGFVINGISEEELAEAKQSLVNSFYLRFSSVSQLSSMLVGMQKYNLGIDFLDKRNEYIANVSLEDVNKVIKKYFTNTPDFVMIGNFDKE